MSFPRRVDRPGLDDMVAADKDVQNKSRPLWFKFRYLYNRVALVDVNAT